MLIETLYLQRNTPEYNQAFDLAVGAHPAPNEPTLLVLSSPAHATEVLKRCSAPLHIASASAFDVAQFANQAQGWAWGAIEAVTLEQAPGAYTRLIWAEPETASAPTIASHLRRLAAPQATLRVIASSFLRRYLPAWQTPPYPAVRPLTPGHTLRVLRTAGWQVEASIAFHGPRASLWGLLRGLAEMVGRPDWGDRCSLAMRTYYREPGWLWPLAPLALIHARAI